jgi:hypothetical protein
MCLVDVVVCNPLAASYAAAEAASPGSTLARAEATKDRRHSAPSDARAMAFFPLALTVFGAPGIRTMQLLKRCAAFTSDPDGFLCHMLTALSVAVQVGNARMVMAATPRWWSCGVR